MGLRQSGRDRARYEGHQEEGATMTLFSVTGACQTKGVIGVFDLETILSEPAIWNRACVRLSPGVLEGLGFRFDGGALIGIDTLKFGPACPWAGKAPGDRTSRQAGEATRNDRSQC
jgi:hypothetical protein